MINRVTRFVLIIGVLLSTGNLAFAKDIGLGPVKIGALEDLCKTEKLKAFAQHSACISRAYIQEAWVEPFAPATDTEVRVEQCKATLISRFERAEARALKKGFECPTYGDALDIHKDVLNACCPLCGCE